MWHYVLALPARSDRQPRRCLPAALVAAAFAMGVVAAAPHSVHHLGEEGEHRTVECPGLLAWTAAGSADCVSPAESLQAPVQAGRLIAEAPAHPRSARRWRPAGRSPPGTP